MKKLLLIALSTSMAMGAHAADTKKFYAGGGVSFWDMKDKSAGQGGLDLTALEGVAGYEILPWLAVEGRAGVGIERESTAFNSGLYDQVLNADGNTDFKQDITDTKGELNYYASVYLKPQIKNDTAVIYGLIGVNTYDVSFVANTTNYEGTYETATDSDGNTTNTIIDFEEVGSSGPRDIDESDTSISVGAGIGFYFKERYVFNIEYKTYIQSLPVGDTDTTLRAQGITLGVNYSF